MNKAVRLLTVLAVWGLTLILGQPVHAQNIPIYAGASGVLSIGGYDFTIDSSDFGNCQIYGRDCAASDDLYLVGSNSGSGPSVAIEKITGGTIQSDGSVIGGTEMPVFSYTCTQSGGCNDSTYDMSVAIDVTGATSGNNLFSVSSLVTGTAASGQENNVAVSENVYSGTSYDDLGTLNASLANTSPNTLSFASENSLIITKDLGLTISGLSNGSTLSLNSVIQSFTRTPEPSSLATFLVGMFALRVTRRKWIRR